MPPARAPVERAVVPAILLLLVAPFAWPLLEPGWLPTHEGLAYPMRLSQVLRCWQDGLWSARWFPDLNNGSGYPFLCFYAPLYYVLAGAFASAGAPLDVALEAPTLLAALVAASGMYVLARRGLGRPASVLAAALFVYAPYVVRDVYIRGDLAEHLALAAVPWALAAILRLAHAPGPRGIALAAVAAAVPILAHNITGMVSGGLFALAAGAAIHASRSRRDTARASVAAGIAALLLTAFFWAPALQERAWVRTEDMTLGPYAVASNFVSPLSLLGPPQVPGAGQELPMSFEPPYVALALLAVALVRRRGRLAPAEGLRILGAAIAAVSMLMTTRLAEPVYGMLPLLRYVQFPWRFLGPAALGFALLGGIAFEGLVPAAAGRLRAVAAAVLALAAILLVAPILGPKPPGPIPAWSVDPEVLAKRRETATGVSEYLPRWAERPANPREFEDGVLLQGEGTVLAAHRRAGRWDLTIEAAAPVTVVLRDLYYPGWQARAGGTPIGLDPRDGTGEIEMALPPGRHDVRVHLGLTPLRRITRVVSIGTLVAVAFALVAGLRRRRTQGPPGAPAA